jgi:NAD(P)H-dependent FMN reductase
MSKPKIGVIVGSTRATRFADKPAEWIANIAKARGDFDVEIVDLRDYPMPFFDEVASSLWAPSKNEVALRWQKKIRELDGYVVIAAEYNRGPTAVLKNALDYAYKEFNNKPIAFVGYGGVGGARAVEQLRMIAVELQMAPVKQAVHINMEPLVAVMRDGKSLADYGYLNESRTAVFDQVVQWAAALKPAREGFAKAA